MDTGTYIYARTHAEEERDTHNRTGRYIQHTECTNTHTHTNQVMFTVGDKEGRLPEKRLPLPLLSGPPAKLECNNASLSAPYVPWICFWRGLSWCMYVCLCTRTQAHTHVNKYTLIPQHNTINPYIHIYTLTPQHTLYHIHSHHHNTPKHEKKGLRRDPGRHGDSQAGHCGPAHAGAGCGGQHDQGPPPRWVRQCLLSSVWGVCVGGVCRRASCPQHKPTQKTDPDLPGPCVPLTNPFPKPNQKKKTGRKCRSCCGIWTRRTRPASGSRSVCGHSPHRCVDIHTNHTRTYILIDRPAPPQSQSQSQSQNITTS